MKRARSNRHRVTKALGKGSYINDVMALEGGSGYQVFCDISISALVQKSSQ